MKDTAVEWVLKRLTEAYTNDEWKEIIKQAKEMEMQQQVYSEEDMAEAFIACWKANVPDGIECKVSFNEWFEQFKKK